MTIRPRVAVRGAARVPRHWTCSEWPPAYGTRRFCSAGVLACLLALAAACGPAAPSPDAGAPASDPNRAAADATTPAPDEATALRRAVVRTYADIAYATYADALRTAEALQDAIDAFLADPTDATSAAAKAAWLASRDVYGQSEAFRFYGGPIDGPESGVEGLVNAWPLDEAYIDYVDGNPAAGIVNAVAEHPEITAGLLVDLNEAGGERNIATGYHAIEFLLWGQDRSADGPGARPAADYVVGVGPNAERRRQVLALEADLLTQHLRIVVDAWDPDEVAGYRAGFVRDADASIARIFTGLVQLSGFELAGERLGVSFETRDQEDEHSCFSDNTHRDFVAGAHGIANIWRGAYGGVDGTGLEALVASVDPALADTVAAAVAAAQSAAGALPPPYDRAIAGVDGTPGRTAVQAAIAAFEDLAGKLHKAATVAGAVVDDAG